MKKLVTDAVKTNKINDLIKMTSKKTEKMNYKMRHKSNNFCNLTQRMSQFIVYLYLRTTTE